MQGTQLYNAGQVLVYDAGWAAAEAGRLFRCRAEALEHARPFFVTSVAGAYGRTLRHCVAGIMYCKHVCDADVESLGRVYECVEGGGRDVEQVMRPALPAWLPVQCRHSSMCGKLHAVVAW